MRTERQDNRDRAYRAVIEYATRFPGELITTESLADKLGVGRRKATELRREVLAEALTALQKTSPR